MLTKRERFLLEIQQKKQEGVTQRELARLYDVHENTIANWLKGLSKPLAINVETKKGPHPDLATTPPMSLQETTEATAHSTASATPSATAMRTNT
jgi:transcriptional regulator with XRE-family HTH domain